MKSLSSKPHHLKRNVLIAGVAVLVISGSFFAYSKLIPTTKQKGTSSQTNPPIDSQPTDEEKQAGQNQKQTTVDEDQNKPSTPTATIGVTITAAHQNGSVVNIRSLINKISNNGTCKLTLVKGTATVAKTSGIQALAESSTCKGFDIPTNELGKGTWQLILNVTMSSAAGTAKQDIVVN